MANVADNMDVAVAGVTTTLSDATLNGAWYDMREFDKGSFLVDLSSVANVPDGRVRLEAAEDALGTNSEIIYTNSADLEDLDGDKEVVVEFRTEDLPDGKPFVRCVVDELGGGEQTMDATIVAILHSPHRSFENLIGADILLHTWD